MRKSHIGWFIAGTLSLGLLGAGAETPPKPSGPGPLAIQDSPPLLRVPEAPAPAPVSEAANAAAPSMPAPEQKPLKSAATASPAVSSEPTPVPSVPFSTKTPSSISTNKQFHVYGGDLQLRGAFCMLCEDTANLLGRVLKDGGSYKLPIFVVLRTPPDIELTGPPVTLGISELSYGGFHLQINAQYRTGFQPEDFTRELVRLLLAERILRDHKRLSATRQGDVLPAWVMTGVSQALEYRSRSRPSALFLAVFKRGDVFSLDRIFSANPTQLDALNRGIYEMSSCALVLTLLDQPDGPVRFARFLNDLAVASKSDRDLLTQHFPNLATSKSSLEKWWTLQMASLATPSAMDSLTASQTEDELDNALMLQIPTSRREPAVAAKPKPAPQPQPASPTPAPPAQPTPPQPARPTAPDTVARSESKEEPQAESTERRPRNFFGWMKRGSKDEAKGEEKQEGKTDEKPKPAEPQKAPDKKSAAIEELGGGQSEKLMAVVDVGRVILAMEALDVTGFFGGEKVALFKKKEKPADETAEAAKGQDTPKEPEKGKGKVTDEKKTPAPAPAPAPVPVEPAKPEKRRSKKDDAAKAEPEKPAPSLSRKPGEARSIGTRPEDLPKAPPPAPAPAPVTEKKNEKAEKPPEDNKKKEEEAKPERRGIRNWFRKDSEGEVKPGETKDTPPQEPPKTEGKSEGGGTRVASRPAPAPTPKTRSPKPGTIPLEDFALIAKRSDREEILTRCATRLNALMLRAHPLYKPVITDYTMLVQEMIDGKTRNAAEKLETLRRQREAVREKSAAIESYLDWYEANHTARLSHEFDDFLRLDGQLEKDRLPRNDSVSKALDSAQKEFGR